MDFQQLYLSALIVSCVQAAAMTVKIIRKQYDDAFTRAVVSLFYLVLFVHPVQIELARFLARWVWVLVGGVEVMTWICSLIIKWRLQRHGSKQSHTV